MSEGSYGPLTGWTAGQRVYLREACSMVCLTSHRRTTTLIPVPLVLVSLERTTEPTPVEVPREVWLVEAHDGGRYVTTHEHLCKAEATDDEAAA